MCVQQFRFISPSRTENASQQKTACDGFWPLRNPDELESQDSYNQASDWLFASPEMHGKQPYWPDSLMRKVIRPAAVRAGITKHVGWHTFRHSYATQLIANGEDIKTVQESLRHASVRVTLGIYAHAIDERKRSAQARVVQAIV